MQEFFNLHYDLRNWRKWKESMSWHYFGVSLNLKCHPFIGKRSEMLGKEGHGFLQFEVALKGKKDNLPKKETSFFHHVSIFTIWSNLFNYHSRLIFISSSIHLASVRKLLDEETQKWPIIWCFDLWKSSVMRHCVSISKV